MTSALTDWLNQWPLLLPWALLLVAFLESLAIAGLILPGVVLLTALSALAGQQQLAWYWLLLSGFIGAVLGDGLSFWLGHHFRDNVKHWWPFNRHPQWLSKGQHFFHRYGGFSIFIGRFVGPVRPVIPLVAGMLKMSVRHFTWINLISALLWAPAYLLPGYLLGKHLHQLNWPPGSGEMLIVVCSALGVILVLVLLGQRYLAAHSRYYQHLQHQWQHTTLWQALQRPRGNNEFPLASLLLVIFAVLGFTCWSLLLSEGHLDQMNERLNTLAGILATPWLVTTMKALSRLADTPGILMLGLPWLVLLVRRRAWLLLLHIGAALAATAAVTTAFKFLFARPRPNVPDHLVGSFAYPSAHTSIAVVAFGMMALWCTWEQSPTRRRWAYAISSLPILTIALSRWLQQVHWVGDLIGGLLLGLVMLGLVRVSYCRFDQTPLHGGQDVRYAVGVMLIMAASRLIGWPFTEY